MEYRGRRSRSLSLAVRCTAIQNHERQRVAKRRLPPHDHFPKMVAREKELHRLEILK